jgi:ABC-2 type transport system permease protein
VPPEPGFLAGLFQGEPSSLSILPLVALALAIPLCARGAAAHVWRRELRTYFTTPTFYLVAATYLSLTSGFFESHLVAFDAALTRAQQPGEVALLATLNLQEGVLLPLFQNLGVLLLFVVPALTMRLVAEERRQHTYELLLTTPLGIGRLLWGKYLAVLTVIFALLAPTAIYPALLYSYGEIEIAPVLLGYFGLLLLAGAVAAIGLFTSSVTENQVVAAVIGFGLALLFYLAGERAQSLEEGTARSVLEYLSLVGHLRRFLEGRLDTRDLCYYASAMLLPIFFAHRALQAQRWR